MRGLSLNEGRRGRMREEKRGGRRGGDIREGFEDFAVYARARPRDDQEDQGGV